jgi:hypothetical protein
MAAAAVRSRIDLADGLPRRTTGRTGASPVAGAGAERLSRGAESGIPGRPSKLEAGMAGSVPTIAARRGIGMLEAVKSEAKRPVAVARRARGIGDVAISPVAEKTVGKGAVGMVATTVAATTVAVGSEAVGSGAGETMVAAAGSWTSPWISSTLPRRRSIASWRSPGSSSTSW